MLYSVLHDHITLGQPYRNGAHSIQHEHLVVMFEDDGETGYFYAWIYTKPHNLSLIAYLCIE